MDNMVWYKYSSLAATRWNEQMIRISETRTTVFVGCAITMLTATPCTRAGTYSLTDLGIMTDLAGQTESRPNAINKQGQVAGVNVVGGSYRGFRYNGSWEDIGTLGGAEAFAAGIEDLGRIVGYSAMASGVIHAFLWTPGGTDGIPTNPQMRDLGTLGGDNSEAYAVNSTGELTGYSDVSGGTSARAHAFVYANAKMIDIGKTVTGLPNSFGYGINASGHVAGAAYDGGYSAPHAFFYDGSKGTDIGVAGALGSTALAINDNDQVVGYTTSTNYIDRAFVYVAGSITDLGTLGGHHSYGLGINNSNVIVGGSFLDAADSLYHAFLYADGRMLDLNTMLDDTGSGWVLVEARAINDVGQIVGTGVFGGATHGFLLTPASVVAASVITAASIIGNDLVLSFQSSTQSTYSIEARQTLTGGSWTDLITGIQGTGRVVTVTNAGGVTLPYSFYRVKGSGG